MKIADDILSPSVIPIPDSTLCGVHGIDSIYMTRAALYARVSTDAQQKDGTIESQLVELKKQIAATGHVLVREYIDDGYPRSAYPAAARAPRSATPLPRRRAAI